MIENETLGKLEEIDDIRTIWESEPTDFTPWLALEENISILSKAIGVDINMDDVATEVNIGRFSADIVATDIDGRKIIIENQLNETDHRHLGQLITYASGLKANVVVWIVGKALEEHRSAIEWLNSYTDVNIGFFLCEIKLWKIDNSKPAVQFVVVEKPNDWAKVTKTSNANNMSENAQRRYEYWTAFMQYASTNPDFNHNFNTIAPNFDATRTFASGAQEYSLNITQQRKNNKLVIRLYVDIPFFKFLESKKTDIEKRIGLKFDWRQEGERSYAMDAYSEADFDNNDKRNVQFKWLIEKMCAIKKTFRDYKDKFKENSNTLDLSE